MCFRVWISRWFTRENILPHRLHDHSFCTVVAPAPEGGLSPPALPFFLLLEEDVASGVARFTPLWIWTLPALGLFTVKLYCTPPTTCASVSAVLGAFTAPVW